MKKEKKISVLFVCMGNICRSPTAEGVFRHIVQENKLHKQIKTDSAGTHAYHVGESPDRRAQTTAKNRGVDLSDIRARRVTARDFQKFDYVLAMDRDNFAILDGIRPEDYQGQLALFLDYAEDSPVSEVPDPYYGGPQGFEVVFDLVEQAARGLLRDIRKRYLD